MAARLTLALCFSALTLAGCQSSKTAFRAPVTSEANTSMVLMHDSQGPEPTQVPRSAVPVEEATDAKSSQR